MFAMWNSEKKAKGKRKKLKKGTPTARRSGVILFFCLFPFAFGLSACRRDMQDQPKSLAYRESRFYKDGISSRPLVEGTVPRGYLREDRELYLGKKTAANNQAGPVLIQPAGMSPTAPGIRLPAGPVSGTSPAALYPDDVETFPFPITKQVLDRGQERFNIFCSVCHGLTGYGDGMVARRGFNKPAPASFHQDRLRQAPVGHFFDVMTNGWGAMPSYTSQTTAEDRWAIIAYIRALQLSQLPPGSSLSGGNPTGKEGAAAAQQKR
jgi:mono/diheme cytochrome c family protein